MNKLEQEWFIKQIKSINERWKYDSNSHIEEIMDEQLVWIKILSVVNFLFFIIFCMTLLIFIRYVVLV